MHYINSNDLKDRFTYKLKGLYSDVGVYIKERESFIVIEECKPKKRLCEEYLQTSDSVLGTVTPVKELEECPVKLYENRFYEFISGEDPYYKTLIKYLKSVRGGESHMPINVKDKNGKLKMKLEDADNAEKDKVVNEDGSEEDYIKVAKKVKKEKKEDESNNENKSDKSE